MDLRRFEPPRWVVLALLALTSICVWVPVEPVMPAVLLDDSWALGLNEAVAQKLVFGKDLVFTFGPYSFVFSKMYHPATDGLMLISSLYLAVTYWLALVLLTRETRGVVPWLLLVVLAAFMNARDTLLLSYPLLVGVVLVRRPGAFAEGQSRNAMLTASLLVSSFGLLPLVKGSMLALCGLVVPIAAGLFAYERRWRLAALVTATPVLALVIWWGAIGQPIGGLPQHFRALSPIISGYAGAMGFPGATSEIVLFLVAATTALILLLRDRATARWPRFAMFCVFGAFYFVSLKAGFVRHDSHALLCGLSVLLASVVLVGVLAHRGSVVAVVTAIVTWAYINARHLELGPTVLADHAWTTYASVGRGLAQRLGEGLPAEYRDTLARIRERSQIPKLEGTTDVYSFNQTELLASGNRWNPRPVLQSYSVYTDYLNAINRAHLAGSNAPDNILFRVEAIDLRLPSLDDGGSWDLLLTRYLPVSFAKDTLILRRRATPVPAQFTAVTTVTGRLNKPIKVPEVPGLVFAEIDLVPSMLGKLLGLVFKPGPLLVEVTTHAGTRTYRYSASMGRLRILVSPLVDTTREFALAYAGAAYLYPKRVLSFRVTSESTKWQWNWRFPVRFSTLALPPAIDASRFVTFDASHAVPPTPIEDVTCDGMLDVVAGYVPVQHAMDVAGHLALQGWIVTGAKPFVVPEAVLVTLTDAQGQTRLFGSRRVSRPDVATYYKDQNLARAGFESSIDVGGLSGHFVLGLAVRDGERVRRCTKWNHEVEIHPVLAPGIQGR